MDSPKQKIKRIKDTSVKIISEFVRCLLILLIIPGISSIIIKVGAAIFGEDLVLPVPHIIEPLLQVFIWFAWQALMIYKERAILGDFSNALAENTTDTSFKSALKFILTHLFTYTDIFVLIVYLAMFGKSYSAYALLFEKNVSVNQGTLLITLIIFLAIPTIIFTVLLRSLRAYQNAETLKHFPMKREGILKETLGFLKSFAVWGFNFSAGPTCILLIASFLQMLLKLIIAYTKFSLPIIAIIIVYAVARVFVKRIRLTRKTSSMVRENGGKIKTTLFAYIPNLLFTAKTYEILKDGKSYSVYIITAFFKHTLVRFYPNGKYSLGYMLVLNKLRIGCPLTPKIKMRFKKPSDETHQNIVVVNPVSVNTEVKEGKIRPVAPLDVIYGTPICGGHSFVNALDRVLRGIHNFSGEGNFKY